MHRLDVPLDPEATQDGLVYRWRGLESIPDPGLPLQEPWRILVWPKKIRSLRHFAGEAKFIGLVPMWGRHGPKMGAQQSKGGLGSTVLPSLRPHLLPWPPSHWASCQWGQLALPPSWVPGNVSSFCFLPLSTSHLPSPTSSACSTPPPICPEKQIPILVRKLCWNLGGLAKGEEAATADPRTGLKE